MDFSRTPCGPATFKNTLTTGCGAAVIVVLFALCTPWVAKAQLGPDGTPINTSNYTIDLTRGVVIGTSRVTGLAGAATSLAEGVEGGLQNPAAVAWRGAQWPDWYDYWLALGFTTPLASGDFYNSGQVFGSSQSFDEEDFFFLIPGVYWQMWNFGIGLTIDAQFITLNGVPDPDTGAADRLRMRFTTFHIQAGYGFFDGQFIVGAGLRILRQRASFSDASVEAQSRSLDTLGLGAEVGILIQPHLKRWRLGAALYPQLSTGRRSGGTNSSLGNPGADPFFVPESTTLPTSGSVGFSIQFGPRPSNVPWISVEVFAAEDLARLDERQTRVKEAEAEELRQARAGPKDDLAFRERMIEARYARKYEVIEKQRKELKKAAWAVLRNRFRNEWPRRYHLLTMDLVVTGSLDQAVGIESFAAQTVQRSGEKVTVSPRVGYETEFWPKRMKGRLGTYVEPSRFAATAARVHVTFGLDINVLGWNVFGLWPDDYRWQVSASFDIAAEYQAVSLGIGGWY
ncbi:MAG: hypothetical protein AAF500_14005 [Myxococcota bacterium]